MDLQTILSFVEGGGTTATVVVAYLIWKLERAMNEFIVEQRAKAESRENAIKDLHDDVKAFIRKLAGVNSE